MDEERLTGSRRRSLSHGRRGRHRLCWPVTRLVAPARLRVGRNFGLLHPHYEFVWSQGRGGKVGRFEVGDRRGLADFLRTRRGSGGGRSLLGPKFVLKGSSVLLGDAVNSGRR